LRTQRKFPPREETNVRTRRTTNLDDTIPTFSDAEPLRASIPSKPHMKPHNTSSVSEFEIRQRSPPQTGATVERTVFDEKMAAA
jgi:hypothetical protein